MNVRGLKERSFEVVILISMGLSLSGCLAIFNNPDDGESTSSNGSSSSTSVTTTEVITCDSSLDVTPDAKGEGTLASPYLLCTADQIHALGDATTYASIYGSYFKLTADIDMNNPLSALPANHNMIGDSSDRFTGNFDGNGYTVSNWSHSDNTATNVGFFGYTDEATIQNLTLSDVTIVGLEYAGGMAARDASASSHVVFSNVSVSGSVQVDSRYGGGIVAYATGRIENASTSGTITCSNDYCGGIAGWSGSRISDSWSSATINGESYAGGLVGRTSSSGTTIENSYATGVVSGTDRCIGGLVGYLNDGSEINDSYATGNVTLTGGYRAAGGLVGRGLSGEINRSQAHGNVYADITSQGVGGLIGYANAVSITISDSKAFGNVYATKDSVGGLAGYFRGTITRSSAHGNVYAAEDAAGGLVGFLVFGGKVYNSHATGDVQAGLYSAGGLIGQMNVDDEDGELTDSYATGNVTGGSTWYAGGLIGLANSATGGTSTISRVYATGTVSGPQGVGGVFGFVDTNSGGTVTVTDCYAENSVTGTSHVGGAIGYLRGAGTTINNCYASSSVTGGSRGGFLGTRASGTVNDSYWNVDVDTIGTSSDGNTTGSAAGTGKSQANMQLKAQFSTPWDWVGEATETWVMPQNDTDSVGFPKLTFSYKCYSDAWTDTTNAEASGAGTRASPYVLCHPGQVQDIGADTSLWDKFFLVSEDIDLSGYTGTQFNVIGNSSTPFSGGFDGNSRNGYTIDQFTYNSTSSYLGLFGYVDGNGNAQGASTGIIGDVQLTNVNTTFGSFSAPLVGYLTDGIVYGSQVTGTVSGTSTIGGLVGSVVDAVVTQSSSEANLTGVSETENFGGLVGSMSGGRVQYSYAKGTVNVASASYVGGLVGNMASSAILNRSYAEGNVTANTYAGGAVGNASNSSLIHNWSLGNVTANSSTGGFMGSADTCTTTNNYWDTTTSLGTSDGATGQATAAMQDSSNFTSWDFNDSTADGYFQIWDNSSDTDYPRLAWE